MAAMSTMSTMSTMRKCNECGTTVPEGQTVCPVCRSTDLSVAPGARAGASGVAGYERFIRRRRLARAATAATTLLLLIVALAVALAAKDAASVEGGPTDQSALMVVARVSLFLLLVNPIVLAAVALVLGLLSYRLWYRALTGERAATEFSVIDALGGRVRR
jgi:multisubunit Na+/H+ antiporter MnhG subunit